MISEERYLLVVNASNIENDWNWIQKNNDLGADLENISEQMSLLAVQGPKANDLLQQLTKIDLNNIKFYHFVEGEIAGIDNVIISATGYTGSGGFELYVNNNAAEKLWDEILKAGVPFDIQPAGLAARDTLRLEMGYCLYGNDIDDQTSPISAGLGWVTKFNKSFIGDEILKDHKENGVDRKLVAFKLLDRGIPRKDYIIVDENNKEIGIVTSGTMGPTVKLSIGLGYVNSEFASAGSKIFISIRNKSISAEVVKLPFYKP
jgi:aminomethyltransferase